MRMVKTGTVDLMIWWKATETIALLGRLARHYEGCRVDQSRTYNDTLEIAMLMVKRDEKAKSTKFSLFPNLVGLT